MPCAGTDVGKVLRMYASHQKDVEDAAEGSQMKKLISDFPRAKRDVMEETE